MKNFNCSLMAAALLTGTVVLSSCSGDELPVGNEVQQLATESAMTFSFSAPAVMGDEADTRVFEIGESSIDSRFDANDRVYVFIKKQGNVIYANDYLTPTNLSQDGKKCTIATDGLTFTIDLQAQGLRPYTPQAGDEVYFYYGMKLDRTGDEPYYSFATNGNKLIESYKDYCLAEMVVKEVDTDNGKLVFAQKEDPSKEYFTFKNINSIFRQKLIFKNSSGAVVKPTIKEITIIITGGTELMQDYFPFSSKAYGTAPIRIQSPNLTDGNIYFSMLFNELNKKGEVSFIAIDTNDNVYTGEKGYPGSGFENNKYYYGDFTLEQKPFKLPNISVPLVRWTDMSNYETTTSNGFLNSKGDTNFDITMSGSSENFEFITYGSGTFTLDNIDAYFPKYDTFLNFFGPDATVILNLKGDNLIKSESYVSRLYSRSNRNVNLKLKCDGSQATITFMSKLTTLIDGFAGFSNNPDFGIRSGQLNYGKALSADQLKDIAAEGYTVERTAVKQSSTNPGYNEITFTVKKK